MRGLAFAGQFLAWAALPLLNQLSSAVTSHLLLLSLHYQAHTHLVDSKLPSTSGGTSSSSAGPPVFLSNISFKNPYCCGPTCLRMSGSISCNYFDWGSPTMDRRFSRTENCTVNSKRSVNQVDRRSRSKHSPWGLLKWTTVLSSLNMFTSSISLSGCTPNPTKQTSLVSQF